ncbi:cytokine-induced anti-apoptosis inhibitor 1, Fe-S biogenesis-domain-containing protein [Staphylotrichum tortipilum]|uniref:Cytokine-induced anti-apoptosis inhibitor 1, Fe-S biogenesis-domain-containing protein n=1 Tax=Staphylotrichum tortipilum TaxID=2831512 RepID=A0AAN6MNY2_9PEZI|nr:cytokine-induced anti-apoptosis inhibitor 1, Fe-S biogenesis-domain-containing protein [Staphylotrichum longicolle]
MPPPAATLDLTPDFTPPSTTTTTTQRTLLLAPPSLAAREDRLSALFTAHPRATTDLQMLDRLAAGLVSLPSSTYDLVLVLTGDGSDKGVLGERAVWGRVVPALKAGGRVGREDGGFFGAGEGREAVLAGLVEGEGGFVKPEYGEGEVVMLKFGAGKKKAAAPPAPAAPTGVGFVDFSDDLDLDAEDDEDVIDEDTLLTEEDLRRPIQQPPECAPQPGKKRRACKDCTCGLAARMEAEDKARRSKADSELNTLKLKSEDLNELDFTVQGKTGSCGSCYLGDAFRCSDCPYIGLPAFKPGEEVKILNNAVQL